MIFYRSFFEAIAGLDVNTKAEVYDAIFDYGLNGVERDLSPIAKAIFTLVKPQIDANNKRKENGKINGAKGAEYGKLGGRPKKNAETETDKKPLETPTKPLDDEIKPSNVNANVNVNDNDIHTSKIEHTDYKKIVDMFNETCVSLPRVTKLTDSRKKKIKARLNDYTIDEMQRAFELVEKSDFLRGKNGEWRASFDWLMENDRNMSKVLDGNYKNNTKKGGITQDEQYRDSIKQDELIKFDI